MFSKRFFRLLPYGVSLILACFFYFSAYLRRDLYDLFINISATLFTIPLLYFSYEVVKAFSHKRLNKEIFDYAKMQIDRELLSILQQLQKVVSTLQEKDLSMAAMSKFLNLKKEDVKKQFIANKYLGFQVFKNREMSEKALHDLLNNSFILEKMEDEQIISIIGILKSVRAFESIQKIDKLYIETEEMATNYKVQKSSSINQQNNHLPERHILLRHLEEDKFIVDDFGDIAKYNLEKCLKYYRVNNQLIDYYTEIIIGLLGSINSWLNTTGLEFIIDTHTFRIRDKYK